MANLNDSDEEVSPGGGGASAGHAHAGHDRRGPDLTFLKVQTPGTASPVGAGLLSPDDDGSYYYGTGDGSAEDEHAAAVASAVAAAAAAAATGGDGQGHNSMEDFRSGVLGLGYGSHAAAAGRDEYMGPGSGGSGLLSLDDDDTDDLHLGGRRTCLANALLGRQGAHFTCQGHTAFTFSRRRDGVGCRDRQL